MTRLDVRQTITDIIHRYSQWAPEFLRHHLDLNELGELALGESCAVGELERMVAEGRQPLRAGSFEWDLATHVVHWSDELCRIYGMEPGTFGGTLEAFLERIHPDDRERTRQLVGDVFNKPRGVTYEHRVVRVDGATRLLYTRVDLITGQGRRPLHMIGSCWDVTDERTVHDNVAGSPWLLRATLEATADGILVVDRVGTIKTFNERFLDLWRIPVEYRGERSDHVLLDFVMDQLEDAERFLHHVHELYASPEEESFDLVRFKDGRVLERNSRPMRIVDAIVGRVWSFRDVTLRERLLARETFLVDASRLLASLDIESALDALARTALPYLGEACAIDLWDRSGARRLTSYALSPQHPLTLELPRGVAGDNARIYDSGGISHMELPLRVKDTVVGAMNLAAPRGRLYDHADLEVADELCRWIALELENDRLLQELEAALRSRDEFLSIAAHEIRGPLASIHLAVETLAQHDLPATTRDHLLRLVAREDRRLARFVDDLIDLGRIRAGRLRFEVEDVNLREVAHEVAARLGTDLERTGSVLTIRSDGEPIIGRWDRFRIDQVITNLLTNAIKFGLGKPIELALAVHEDTAILTVTDHGIGVSPEQRERIFEPFERGVSLRHYGGLGLGLFIVRTIVTHLCGAVRVEPVPDGGSRFIVELPTGKAP